MKDVIVKEHVFNHPMQEVWSAISDQKEISSWFIKADFRPEVGYNYTFLHEEGEQCTTIIGKVLESNPIEKLVYTWIVKGTGVETTVSWELTDHEGVRTHLKLVHSGIANYPAETAVKMFESFSGGWMNCIGELETYLKAQVHA